MKTRLLLLCLLLATVQTFARNISGRLTDGNQQPVEFANVVLLALPDSAFLQGTISAANGSFQLPSDGKTERLLRISCIGYATVFKKCVTGDIGTVLLALDSLVLDEVVIKASLPATRLRGDALVTNVQSGILSKAGSATDVLSKIPGIIQKGKDAFEVFGKGAPLIYINGRQVRDISELENLRSEDIKEVELITNPGAKYDSTVKAVIRIKTVKHQGDGFGFDLRSSWYQWDQTDLMEEVRLNYRHKGLDLFGSYRYSYNENYRIGYLNQTVYTTDKEWTQNSVILEPKFDRQYHRAEAGLNYQISDNHSVGARYTYSGSARSVIPASITGDIYTDGEFYDHLITDTRYLNEPTATHRLNAYYNGKIQDLEIDFNVDYYKGENDFATVIREKSENYDDRDVNSQTLVANDLIAGKLVLTYPVLGGSFTLGGEYTRTNRNDDYISEGEYVPTSYTMIKEDNLSGFVEYSRKLPFGQLSTGIRYEHVAFDYYEDDLRVADQSRNYDNWFPNISFGTTLGKVQTQLSYTAKTQRPSYRELSTNVYYANRFTYETGNATLKPSIFHDLTLSGTWKFLQASVSYQVKNDPIYYWSRLMDDTPGAALLYYVNLDKLPSLQAMVSASPEIGVWMPRFSMGMMKQWFDLESGGKTVNLDKPVWTLGWGNSLKLPADLLLSVDYELQSDGHINNFYSHDWTHNLSASVRKSFLKDALNVTVGMSDILYKNQGVVSAYTPYTCLRVDNRFDTREVYVTVRYRFNSAKNKYKGTGAGSETLRRL